MEYQDVLSRPKFQFDTQIVDAFLAYIKQNGQIVSGTPLKKRLPDPDDEPFLEIAIAIRAACLITGNKKHFPKESRQNTRIVTSSEFIEFYRKYDEGTEQKKD